MTRGKCSRRVLGEIIFLWRDEPDKRTLTVQCRSRGRGDGLDNVVIAENNDGERHEVHAEQGDNVVRLLEPQSLEVALREALRKAGHLGMVVDVKYHGLRREDVKGIR